ncbi:MAG TPA: DinB family protein [Candidatus Kapabacteria bacterium]|nr:DinB family protein [Candidatus Kapabacteria bacterium]
MNDYFLEMFEYNKYANNLYIKEMIENNIENTKINKLFSHVLNSHNIWLCRLQKKFSRFKLWDVHANQMLSEINQQLYIESLYYVNVLSPSDFKQTVEYKVSTSESFENTVLECLTQIITHGAHHRAQISLLLRQLDIEPPKSNYIFYLRDTNK